MSCMKPDTQHVNLGSADPSLKYPILDETGAQVYEVALCYLTTREWIDTRDRCGSFRYQVARQSMCRPQNLHRPWRWYHIEHFAWANDLETALLLARQDEVLHIPYIGPDTLDLCNRAWNAPVHAYNVDHAKLCQTIALGIAESIPAVEPGQPVRSHRYTHPRISKIK